MDLLALLCWIFKKIQQNRGEGPVLDPVAIGGAVGLGCPVATATFPLPFPPFLSLSLHLSLFLVSLVEDRGNWEASAAL